MTRIAHLSDLHIGATLSGVAPYRRSPRIDPVEEPYRSVESAFARVLDDEYDAVVIAGDVFDRGATKRDVQVFDRALERLHEAGIPVAIISGNHDAEQRLAARVTLPPSATWFGAEKAASLVWDDLGVAVHGRSIARPDELRNLSKKYPAPVRGLVNLGLLHTSIGGAYSRRPCAPTTTDRLGRAGYDYWALGHVHQRMAFGRDGSIVYSGSPFGRRPEEHGGHGFMKLRIRSGAVRSTPVDTATIRYVNIYLTRGGDHAREITAAFASDDAMADDATVIWSLPGDDGPGIELAREIAADHVRRYVSERVRL
ncbi:MAG: metallophosphoesterase family protein [Microbacterium sp.]